MSTATTLRRITLAALLASLFGCAGTSTRNEGAGSLAPLDLTAENFYELLSAELMPASVANSLLSLGECADNGVIRIEGPGAASASVALAELTRQFRVALARSGSNTYVLQSVDWVVPEQSPGTISVVLQARGIICSA